MKDPRPSLLAVPLACPHDALPLTSGADGFVCQKGHNHNLSKYGYVNLLPVALKPSRDPGDSKAMVQARHSVMSAGCFQSVADALCVFVAPHLSTRGLRDRGMAQPRVLVDAGCGDGYFTTALAEHLAMSNETKDLPILGVDISRWAVASAARHHRQGAWAVATNRCLPVQHGTATMITSLFGFETWPQWAALQHPGQWVVTASAGPQHLLELREQIYSEVTIRHTDKRVDAEAAGYALKHSSQVEYVADIGTPDVAASLLAMTPHAHRVSATRRTAVSSLDLPRVRIDVMLRAYQFEGPA